MNCNGDGHCHTLNECSCECYDDCKCFDDCDCENEYSCYHECNCECKCDDRDLHSSCVLFCKYAIECCTLFDCHNYDICGNSAPKYYLEKNDGLCPTCYIMFGHLKMDKKDECLICATANTNLVRTSCDHSICLSCFETIAFMDDYKCPFCRRPNV